jgi:RNA polymerase sigma-B factor
MTSVASLPSSNDLLRAYHLEGDLDARAQLVEQFLPLVRSLALRYAGRGEPMDDLVQVGALGLIKAIDRFDLDRGVELSTYAVPTIVGEIRRHFRDKGWAMHVPRRIKELHVRLARTVEELSASLGRSPTVAELATATDATEEDVIEALESASAYSTRSLSGTSVDGDEVTDLLEVLGTDDLGYVGVDASLVIDAGLEALDPRERRIVELRFFEELTQSQIAEVVGISQMHVSRLLRQALETMRGRIDGPEEPSDR